MNKIIAIAAAIGTAFLVSSAQAAPVGNVATVGQTAGSQVENVDYRGYRHCHWRNGRKLCHGARGYRYRSGPSFGIYIGPRHSYHRGWRGHKHRGWKRHRGTRY